MCFHSCDHTSWVNPSSLPFGLSYSIHYISSNSPSLPLPILPHSSSLPLFCSLPVPPSAGWQPYAHVFKTHGCPLPSLIPNSTLGTSKASFTGCGNATNRDCPPTTSLMTRQLDLTHTKTTNQPPDSCNGVYNAMYVTTCEVVCLYVHVHHYVAMSILPAYWQTGRLSFACIVVIMELPSI